MTAFDTSLDAVKHARGLGWSFEPTTSDTELAARLDELLETAERAGWRGYVRNLNDMLAMLEGCYVYAQLGQYVCDYFKKYLRHSKGQWAGKPFELSDIQKDRIVMPLFSWVRADGTRRFRSLFCEVAQKNFKSTLMAGLQIYMLDGDGEDGAECYIAANDRAQAGIIYKEAAAMVLKSPELRDHLKVIPSTKTITKGMSSWISALSAEWATAEGKNSHFTVVDELHAFDSRGKELYEALRFQGAVRTQPIAAVITTAGEERIGICYEEYEYSKGVATDRIIDTEHLSVIFEAGDNDDWTLEETWRKANPHLGITIKVEELRAACQRAIQDPTKQAAFKRRRLNIWCISDENRQKLDFLKWMALGDQSARIEDLKGHPVCCGLDLSSTTDLTSLVYVFRDKDDISQYFLWPYFWLPSENIEVREKEDRAPYRLWAEQGWLELTPGPRIEYAAIENKLVEASQTFGVHEIGFDLHNAEMIRQRVEAEHGIVMVAIPQTCSGMNAGAKEIISLCESGRLHHNGNPIMNRMVESARFHSDGNGNLKPMKNDKHKRRLRIDGVTAAVNAMTRALLMPQYSGDSGGLVVL